MIEKSWLFLVVSVSIIAIDVVAINFEFDVED